MAKNVIIMGATSGIGEALAARFAELGCDIAIAGRREDRLASIADRLRADTGCRVVTAAVDVRSESAPEKIRAMAEELGGLDLYIHSSGIGRENPELDPAIETGTAETNALGFVRCVGAAVAILEEQGRGGQVAAISSVAATRGLGIAPAYSATKALQANYLEALRQRSKAKKTDIRVTDIRPGFVATPLIAGRSYPATMPLSYAADRIAQAILAKRRVAWIDWRYMLLCAAWKLLPGVAWEAIPAGFVPFETPEGAAKAGAAAKDAAQTAAREAKKAAKKFSLFAKKAASGRNAAAKAAEPAASPAAPEAEAAPEPAARPEPAPEAKSDGSAAPKA